MSHVIQFSPAITHMLLLLKDSWLGQAIAASSWVYTVMLMLHFTGMAMLFGAMSLIDIRLMGLTRQIPLNVVLSFLPVAIIGFIINAGTGFCFFAFDPIHFGTNPAFQVKMALVLIAGLNALWFTLVEDKKLRAIPPYGDTTLAIKISAGLSISLWTLVIICGRMIVGVANLSL
jgi:hypothetical protein